MICKNCGMQNQTGNYCIQCGAPLPKPPSRAALFFGALGRAVCYFLFFFGMQTLVISVYEFFISFSISLSVMSSGAADMETLYDEAIAAVMEALQQNLHILMILSVALTLLALALIFRLRKKNPFAEMHIRPAAPLSCVMGVLFGLALQVFVVLTVSILPVPQWLIDSHNQNTELLHGGPIAIEIINVVIFTPILEEIIFRGLVFTRLSRGMKTVWAVVLSAVIFGAVHGSLFGFIYAGALGAVLACVMLRQNRSVLVPIFVHAGFNGGSYLLMLMGETPALPLMLALYLASMAGTVAIGYMLLRRAEEP